MPQIRDARVPFHSEMLHPRVTRMEEVRILFFVIHEWVVFKESEEVSGKAYRQKGA